MPSVNNMYNSFSDLKYHNTDELGYSIPKNIFSSSAVFDV